MRSTADQVLRSDIVNVDSCFSSGRPLQTMSCNLKSCKWNRAAPVAGAQRERDTRQVVETENSIFMVVLMPMPDGPRQIKKCMTSKRTSTEMR